MKLELHTHTNYSHRSKVFYDGVNSPEEMVRQAARNGTGALVITDHDTMKGFPKARKAGRKYGIQVIPGEEVTTKRGHVVAVNIQDAIPAGLSLRETIDRIHSQGGLAIASHPFDIMREPKAIAFTFLLRIGDRMPRTYGD